MLHVASAAIAGISIISAGGGRRFRDDAQLGEHYVRASPATLGCYFLNAPILLTAPFSAFNTHY